MRTVNKKLKQAACTLVNQMCGVDVAGVSGAEDQCECLIGAIIVCISIHYICFFSLFRMEMTIHYAMMLG